MQFENYFFGGIYLFCGLAFILVSIPLVRKKIPMNRRYGFRLGKAFSCDENWYLINSYGGRQMIRWSVALITFGALTLISPIQGVTRGTPNVLLTVLPLIICTAIPIIMTILYARRLP